MKIVHLTASRFLGGPERQMLGLAGSLSPAGESVFVSFSEGGLCRTFLDEVRRSGMQAVELGHDTPRLGAALLELGRSLRRLNPDVLCCHGYKANLLGLLAARRIGMPVVSVSRGWTGETSRVRLYERVDRFVLRWMDRVVCVSEAQAAKVRGVGVRTDKILVIRNAVDTGRFAPPQTEYRDRLQGLFAEPRRWIVGAAGRLSPEKGFDVLVEAAAEVLAGNPLVGFVLFGEGALRDRLASRIREAGLEGRFVLAGFRSDLDMYLSNLDVAVLPSFTEGLPNVVLEAFAAGVPVVATDVGGTSEVVEEGSNGHLVRPGDPAALAQRVTDLLADGRTRREMGDNARRRVEEAFSFRSQASEYGQLFDRLASSNKKRAVPSGASRRPVRVCFMIDNLSGSTTRAVVGGTETQLLSLIEGVDRTKIRPHLCLLDGTNEASRSLEPEGCPVLRLGLRSLARPRLAASAWRFVRFLRRERIDVLQVSFPDSTCFAVPLARLAGVRCIMQTRRNLGHSRPSRLRRGLGGFLNRWIDGTVANCEACREAVIDQEGVRPESVVVLPNGIDLKRFAGIVPVGSHSGGRAPIVGMVANLRPVKGPEVFVEAARVLAKSHGDVVFQIAGGGDEALFARLIETAGLGGRVELKGCVDDVA
ncbi:MAG: glycosyltransferase, partial [Planctomycetes bacterium]|nr:glycosyltransferase [Planctomycetota bacterium]